MELVSETNDEFCVPDIIVDGGTPLGQKAILLHDWIDVADLDLGIGMGPSHFAAVNKRMALLAKLTYQSGRLDEVALSQISNDR